MRVTFPPTTFCLRFYTLSVSAILLYFVNADFFSAHTLYKGNSKEAPSSLIVYCVLLFYDFGIYFTILKLVHVIRVYDLFFFHLYFCVSFTLLWFAVVDCSTTKSMAAISKLMSIKFLYVLLFVASHKCARISWTIDLMEFYGLRKLERVKI